MLPHTSTHGCVIVGAGPGGLAPLFAAAASGSLPELLHNGVIILERSTSLGAGSLGDHAIPSDSPAVAFLDIVTQSKEPALQALATHPLVQQLATFGDGSAPLPLVGRFLRLAATALCDIVARSPRGRVLTGVEVLEVRQLSTRTWQTRYRHLASGAEHQLRSRAVVLATGAHQPAGRLATEPVAGEPLLPRFTGKLLQSGDLFRAGADDRLLHHLGSLAAPRIVIVGGSTSAGAAAVRLLRSPALPFLAGASVTILHRSPLRIFYPSAQHALDDGYTDFTAADLCPLTGRLFRLGGLRFQARELLLSARSIGGRAPEPRLHLHSLDEANPHAAQHLLARADLIVAALGYRPRLCPVLAADGSPIPLHQPTAADWAIVDGTCQVRSAAGPVLPGLFAVGLSIGPAASRELGGEANFRGQVNGLWLWQNTLGRRIAAGLLDRSSGLEPAKPGDTGALAAGLLSPSISVNGDSASLRIQGQWRASAAMPSVPMPAPAPLRYPVIAADPPRLSEHLDELRDIETSGVFSNYGPVNTRFERTLTETVFEGRAHCTTVSNATIGLMLAIREVLGDRPSPRRRFALMPSFTFAATAQAAIWCGLTPLLCDVDPNTWLPDAAAEEALLQQYAGEVAVIVPYATFGNNLDLARYERLSERHNVPIVVDAAASLGSRDQHGRAFGAAFPWPVVFSMHATKLFSTGEGGVITSSDPARIARLRSMAAFGFAGDRTAVLPGLNAKLTEIAALSALLQLGKLPEVLAHREALAGIYARELHGVVRLQQQRGRHQALAFQPILLPTGGAPARSAFMEALRADGIGTATYFSPHLAEQSFLRRNSVVGPLPHTEHLAQHVVVLPLLHSMSPADVTCITASVHRALDALASAPATGSPTTPRRRPASVPSVTALLHQPA